MRRWDAASLLQTFPSHLFPVSLGASTTPESRSACSLKTKPLTIYTKTHTRHRHTQLPLQFSELLIWLHFYFCLRVPISEGDHNCPGRFSVQATILRGNMNTPHSFSLSTSATFPGRRSNFLSVEHQLNLTFFF